MYDTEIAARTGLVTGIVAALTGPKIGLSPEIAGGLGFIAGMAIDKALYHLKLWLKTPKGE